MVTSNHWNDVVTSKKSDWNDDILQNQWPTLLSHDSHLRFWWRQHHLLWCRLDLIRRQANHLAQPPEDNLIGRQLSHRKIMEKLQSFGI